MYDRLKYNKNLQHISCVNALGPFVRSRIVDCWTNVAQLARHNVCECIAKKVLKFFFFALKRHDDVTEKKKRPATSGAIQARAISVLFKCVLSVRSLARDYYTWASHIRMFFYLNSPSCRARSLHTAKATAKISFWWNFAVAGGKFGIWLPFREYFATL